MENIVIFGAARNGLRVKKDLEAYRKYKICYFCDNNIKKQNCQLDGVDIVSFEHVVRMYQNGFCGNIVIALIDPEEVVNQIRESNLTVPVYGLTREYLFKESIQYISPADFLYQIDVTKPRLEYYEYHVAHHCNLKCKGCGHFSNVAKPEFGDLVQYKKDIKRLKELFWGVKRIRLMGGEPLLNVQLADYIVATREVFPDANIRVVTNGLLIPEIGDNVFKAMHANFIGFDITQYPPTREMKEKIELRCIENDVEFMMSPLVERFFDISSTKIETDIKQNFEKCISKSCHFLQDGKISVCGKPILYKKNKEILKRELVISDEDIVDIYDKNIDGFLLNDFLNKPIPACRNCDNVNKKWFKWVGHYPHLD